MLCHPELPVSLLPAGQGGGLKGRGADTPLIRGMEAASGQIDRRRMAAGPAAARGAEGRRVFLRFSGQAPAAFCMSLSPGACRIDVRHQVRQGICADGCQAGGALTPVSRPASSCLSQCLRHVVDGALIRTLSLAGMPCTGSPLS